MTRPPATLTLALTLALTSAGRAAAQGAPPPADPVAEGALRFGLGVWRAAAADPDQDACLGPLSASCALGMTALGARGPTQAEMLRALGLGGLADHGRLAALLAPPAQEGVTVAAANRLYLARTTRPRAAFLRDAAAAYGAEPVVVDFAPDPDPARRAINAWVGERTQGKIPELLAPADVQDSTAVVLVNALYFKAAWAARFDPAETAPAPFTLPGGQAVDVPTMRRGATLRCAELEDGARAVELPFRGERLAALVIVPGGGGLRALEARLDAATFAGWVRRLTARPAQVALPRFEVRWHADLAGHLAGLGMPLAVSTRADFSGMLEGREVAIGKVIHEAVLRVDEEGSEGAASTAVVMVPGSAPQPPFVVAADRPFLLAIRDRTTGAVLFLARVTDPR